MIDTGTSPLSRELKERLDAVEVAPEIFVRWPDYRVLVIVADGLNQDEAQSTGGASPLSKAEETVRALNVTDWTAHPHIAEWMEAFKGFGAKPKRTSPSALALLKRVNDGLPRIDPVTDSYNAISIAHVLPIGGEDFAAYVGHPRLVLATGDEPFDTIDQGEPFIDHPAPGEVIWRDDAGVTCRRWNWRQGVRTRIMPETTTALFILEALGAMPDEELLAAGAELVAGLRALSPAVATGSRLIQREKR
jgi:DNA/RNA-binding domain of Phe-tRNA-synthetase-like protein